MSAARWRVALASVVTAVALAACAAAWTPPAGAPTPQLARHAPLRLDSRRTATPPTLDGRLDDAAWRTAQWTADFGDIQGPALPPPRYRTRAALAWDDDCLYVAAELREPHVSGALTQRDQVVYHDNDFEVFLDPDGDGREYYELEINALGTVFDLYLRRSYRAGGPADHGWNAVGERAAIAVLGTRNDARDVDDGWTLEWAIPWSAFVPPPAHGDGDGERARGGRAPRPGETWRVNFSRVQWAHDREDGVRDARGPADYRKLPGRPEDNWTWTPQWQVDMHDPRFWGFVRFVR